MQLPIVSVVIPFYKGEEYLEKTLDSISTQTFTDLEVIVVNDGSPSCDLAYFANIENKYDRIRVIHKSNGGVACARQFGIAEAKGEFIAFCDQDDLWLPDKLTKQIPLFENEKVGLVYCGAIEDHITENRKVELPFFESYRGNIFSTLTKKNEIVSCTAVARKSLLVDVQAFDKDIDLMGVDDWLAWLKLSLVCDVDFVEEYLAIHIFHESNYSSNEAKMYKAELVCLDKIRTFANAYQQNKLVNYVDVEINIHLRYAESFIYTGEFRSGSAAVFAAEKLRQDTKLNFKGIFFKYCPILLLKMMQYIKRLVS